jgi:hypothetical protein
MENNKNYYLAKEEKNQDGGFTLFKYYSPFPMPPRDPQAVGLYANPMMTKPAGIGESREIARSFDYMVNGKKPTKTFQTTGNSLMPFAGSVTVPNARAFVGMPSSGTIIRNGGPTPGFAVINGPRFDPQLLTRGPPVWSFPFGASRRKPVTMEFKMGDKTMKVKVPGDRVRKMYRILYKNSIRSRSLWSFTSTDKLAIKINGWTTKYANEKKLAKAINQLLDTEDVEFTDGNDKVLSRVEVLNDLNQFLTDSIESELSGDNNKNVTALREVQKSVESKMGTGSTVTSGTPRTSSTAKAAQAAIDARAAQAAAKERQRESLIASKSRISSALQTEYNKGVGKMNMVTMQELKGELTENEAKLAKLA